MHIMHQFTPEGFFFWRALSLFIPLLILPIYQSDYPNYLILLRQRIFLLAKWFSNELLNVVVGALSGIVHIDERNQNL
jgi:hypothetical protein